MTGQTWCLRIEAVIMVCMCWAVPSHFGASGLTVSCRFACSILALHIGIL